MLSLFMLLDCRGKSNQTETIYISHDSDMKSLDQKHADQGHFRE